MGTSSYREAEETDVIFLWGANARENHPIFFHHVLKGVHNGARLFVVDPAPHDDRPVGRSLAGPQRRHRHRAGQRHGPRDHPRRSGQHDVHRARDRAASRRIATPSSPTRSTTPEQSPACRRHVIREAALAYARADRAMICWTLGITEHHNAVDNVLALINLALLTGHVGRYGSGLNPLRGQNNVQGGGDMGAIPNRLVGFQDILDPDVRARFEQGMGRHAQARVRLHDDRDVRGHGRRAT